jgi:hypothetical protein
MLFQGIFSVGWATVGPAGRRARPYPFRIIEGITEGGAEGSTGWPTIVHCNGDSQKVYSWIPPREYSRPACNAPRGIRSQRPPAMPRTPTPRRRPGSPAGRPLLPAAACCLLLLLAQRGHAAAGAPASEHDEAEDGLRLVGAGRQAASRGNAPMAPAAADSSSRAPRAAAAPVPEAPAAEAAAAAAASGSSLNSSLAAAGGGRGRSESAAGRQQGGGGWRQGRASWYVPRGRGGRRWRPGAAAECCDATLPGACLCLF